MNTGTLNPHTPVVQLGWDKRYNPLNKNIGLDSSPLQPKYPPGKVYELLIPS